MCSFLRPRILGAGDVCFDPNLFSFDGLLTSRHSLKVHDGEVVNRLTSRREHPPVSPSLLSLNVFFATPFCFKIMKVSFTGSSEMCVIVCLSVT